MIVAARYYLCLFSDARSGTIPASMIPIPAHLFDSDSDSSNLGYNSDSESNTICMNDSDSYSIPTAALLIL